MVEQYHRLDKSPMKTNGVTIVVKTADPYEYSNLAFFKLLYL